MSHPNPLHDHENEHKSDDSTHSDSYKRALRGAIHRKKQMSSPIGKLKRLLRSGKKPISEQIKRLNEK